MTDSAQPQTDPNCLISDFVSHVEGVTHAVMASEYGLPLAASATVSDEHARNLAAASAALTSLADGAAQQFDVGMGQAVVVTMSLGQLLLMPTTSGTLAVQVHPVCDLPRLIEQTRPVSTRLAHLFPPLRTKYNGDRPATLSWGAPAPVRPDCAPHRPPGRT